MLHRLPNSIPVVDGDVAYARKSGPDVDEHKWNFSVTQILNQRIFHAEGQDGHTVHTPLDHPAYGQLHPLRVIDGGSQKNFVVVLDRQILERLDEFGEKWVGDFRNDQPEHAASAGDQGTRGGVRIVAEFLDHLPDSLGKLRINGRYAVNRARYCGSRDLGSARDLPDIHEKSGEKTYSQ